MDTLIGSLLLLAEGVIGFWLMDGFHSAKWRKKHHEVSRLQPTEKRPSKKITRKKKEKLATVFTLLGAGAGFGSWGFFVLAPNPRVFFGSMLLVFGFISCAFAFWEYFEWSAKLKVPILAIATVASAIFGTRWVRDITRPSFTFVVPVIVVDGNSWDFVINHRGSKSSESVQMMFVDLDKRNVVLGEKKPLLTPQDMDSYERILTFLEVNPMGRDHLYAMQFIWTPLDFAHEHYEIEVTAKDRSVHQDLQIENVNGKWEWATQIKDTETGDQLLNCKDAEFPYGSKAPIRCFPEVTGYGK